MSQTILDSNTHSVGGLKTNLSTATNIVLEEGSTYKVVLLSAKIPNTVNNIIEGVNDTMRVSNDRGVTWHVLTIAKGFYDIVMLQVFLKSELIRVGFYTDVLPYTYSANLYSNRSTRKCYFTTINNDFFIDLSNDGNSTLFDMLGFTNEVLKDSTVYIAQNEASFRWVDNNAFIISCNLVDNSNGVIGSCLYQGSFQSEVNDIELFPAASEYTMLIDLSKNVTSNNVIRKVSASVLRMDGTYLPISSTRSDDSIVIKIGIIKD